MRNLGGVNKMAVFIIAILLFSEVLFADQITLDQSIDYAINHNQSVLIAKEKITASEGSIISARALLLPQITATAGYTRASYLTNFSYGDPTKLPIFDATGKPTGDYLAFPSFSFSADRMGDLYSGKVSLNYTLFAFGKLQANYDISLISNSVNIEDYNRIVSDTKLSVKQSFYSILLMQELIKVLDETSKSLNLHLETTNKRYDAGLVSKFEVLRAKVQLANIQPQRTKANNQLEIAVINFNAVLGAETNNKFIPIGELKYEREDFSLDECLKVSHEKRPEVKQMQLRRAMAKEAVTIASSNYWPSVIFTTGYQGNRGQQFPPNDTKWYTGWDAGVYVNIPIFDGFSTYGKVKETKANLEQAEIAEKQFERVVDMEVKSSYLTLKSSEDTILAQKENVEVAKESLKIIKERYNQGQATNLEVLDTEVSLLQAETNYLQALYDYNIAKGKLKKSIGRE